MDNKVLDQVKEQLSIELKKYVTIIKKEYEHLIPIEKLEYLNGISDFKEIIKIEQTNTISMFVFDGIMYFPINAFSIIGMFKKIPGYGVNKNHKTYDENTLIINDNTYLDYIKHVFLAGLTPIEFYLETLLHETTHLCGVGGASALREGFAELKTRELAKKYNLKTSACGYPKEVKIALELQNIFGSDIGNKIAFARNDLEIIDLLKSTFGYGAVLFYMEIQHEMKREFDPYFSKKYPGITGPINKTKEYEKIDYKKVEDLINSYKNSLHISTQNSK